VNTAPYFNLTIARQILIDDPGIITTGLNATDNPNDPAWLSADLVSFNYTYYGYNSFREILYPLLRDWFDALGINLTEVFDEWWPFIGKMPDWYFPERYDNLQICYLEWGTDILDPFLMLHPLFSNISRYTWGMFNVAQVNDTKLEKMMNDAMLEIDETIRTEIYKNISHYLAEELYPHAFLYHNKVYHVHSADLYDVPYNAFNDFHAYHIKRNLNWIPPF
jgi:ABC-type transport system substrate-binding protein